MLYGQSNNIEILLMKIFPDKEVHTTQLHAWQFSKKYDINRIKRFNRIHERFRRKKGWIKEYGAILIWKKKKN